MKKILLASIAVAACGVSAFGQGTILFENADNSTANIRYGATGSTFGNSTATASGSVVELFFNNGSSYVLDDTYTSTYSGGGNALNGPGYFNAGQITIPSSGTQSFEVEAFYTSGGTEYSGVTASFTATVEPTGTPPVPLDAGAGAGSSWNGDLVLHPVPEPTTIALGGLGAAALLLFRRRK